MNPLEDENDDYEEMMTEEMMTEEEIWWEIYGDF